MTPSQPYILLVEDDEDDALFMRRAFSDVGISCPLEVVVDGARAIQWLSRPFLPSRPRPVGVLLDLKLPRVSGLEVLRWLRRHPELGAMPVIVLSSSNDERDIEAASALGIDGFMVKPVSFGDLVQSVQVIASTWGLQVRARVPT